MIAYATCILILTKIDKKACKNIDIYYIGYITIKNSHYVKVTSVNPLYLILLVKQMVPLKKKKEKIHNFCFYR